jgi:sugar phosphate permease
LKRRPGLTLVINNNERIWKIRAFFGTWIAYVGFYLCRKNYPIAQPEFMKEFGWNEMQVGMIISGFLIIYSLGQFINGVLGDKWGPRLVLITGMFLSAFSNFLFGFSSTVALMFVLYTLNGYFQSTGWPCCIKIMTNWIPLNQRGKVMPWWGTCYQVGDIIATAFAGFVLGLTAEKHVLDASGNIVSNYFNWRWAFWVPALVLVLVTILVKYLVRSSPECAGLEKEKHSTEDEKIISGASKKSLFEITLDIFKNRAIVILGVSYFCIKFIRYTFWFWIPTYMVKVLGYKADDTAYILTLFPIFGFFGTLFAGYVSDRFYGSRRGPVTVFMLLGLSLSLLFYVFVTHDLIYMMLAVGFIGFFTYGPDFLVSGIAVMDFGSKEHSGTAAGFVNGVGGAGAALTGLIGGGVATLWGWNAVLYLLVGFALLCAAILMFLWNAVGENSN